MSMYDKLFQKFETSGILIEEKQREKIKSRLDKVLNYVPRVGVFGKTGVGKSSLCNALFGTDVCLISDVAACTRNPQEVLLEMDDNKGIKLIDVPGVGESSERDEEYARLYAELLPELDLVLWVIKADDRAMSSDEQFYKNIVKPHIEQGKPIFFVLNQVDKIEPFREWDEQNHKPGPNQNQRINEKGEVVANFFNVVPSKVIPVSVNEKYNLVRLVDEIIFALPNEKKITVYKAVNDEYKSDSTNEHVKKSWWEVVKDTVEDVVETVVDKVTDAIDWIADTFFWWW